MILSWLNISWSTLPTGHVMQSFKLDRGIKSILCQIFSSVSSHRNFDRIRHFLKALKPNQTNCLCIIIKTELKTLELDFLNPVFWYTLISRILGSLEDKD